MYAIRSYYGFCLLIPLLESCTPSEAQVVVRKVTNVDQAKEWGTDVRYPVFSSPDPAINTSLEVLNKQLSDYVSGLEDLLKIEAKELFADFEIDSLSRPDWAYELGVSDTVYLATDDYISLQLVVYHFSGGAHGMTNFIAFNYDVAKQKVLTNGELLDLTQLERINQLLKADFNNREQCFDTDPTMDLVSAITFSADTVRFIFEQYTLGAYACGPAEVLVPKTELGEIFLPKIELTGN